MKGTIVAQAIAGMPSARQQEAYEVTLLSAAGHGPIEIAKRMDLRSWRAVEEIREEIGNAIVSNLRSGGYSPGEIAATLGIPTPMGSWNGDTQISSASQTSGVSAAAASRSPKSGREPSAQTARASRGSGHALAVALRSGSMPSGGGSDADPRSGQMRGGAALAPAAARADRGLAG